MKVSIICDGESDYRVLSKTVRVIIEKHHSLKFDENDFLRHSLNLRNDIDVYLKAIKSNSIYSIESKGLVEAIHKSLFNACGILRKEGIMDCKHLLILNTDAEKILATNSNYFKEEYYHLQQIFEFAIATFYDKMVNTRYAYDALPLICPALLFPSSEILVAAAMVGNEQEFSKEKLRKKQPKPDLKKYVYNTDHIPDADIEGILNTFLDENSLARIYQLIPELRKLIQFLAFQLS